MKKKLSLALSLSLILSLLLSSGVLADDVANDIDLTVDAAYETVALVVGGSTRTVDLFIVPKNDDGKNGCNLTGSTTLTISAASSTPGVATVAPSQVTFTNCEAVGTNWSTAVTVTPVSTGSTNITFTLVDNTTAGTFDLTPANFAVNVTAPTPSDTTPPVITPSIVGTLGNNGWYVSDVTVSWTVVDDESTISSKTGCDPTTISADTAGVTLTCSATSAGGTASESVTIKLDKTAPTIQASMNPADPALTGWYNFATGAPTVSFTCDDAMSGIASCSDPYLFSDGAGQSYTGYAVDQAGNQDSAGVENVDVDLGLPTITAALDKSPDVSGWFNVSTGAPTVSFTCSDATSGVKSCSDPYLFGEGENQSKTGYVEDNAGNQNSDSVEDVDVDLTAPGLTWVGSINDGDVFYWGFVPDAPTCSATDALSGPNGCDVTGYSEEVGAHTLTATAHDVAGNKTEETRNYTILAWTLKGFYQPVDMGGVLNTVKGGSTVPLKFELFAGPTELSDVAYVKSLTTTKIACAEGTPTDQIETTATGGTSLRYDLTGGQYIFNWQTPKTPGVCIQVKMTALDGSFLTANFKLK